MLSGKKYYIGAAALAILAPVTFLLAIPWLKVQDSDALIYLFAGLAATTTVVASFVLAIMEDRKMDEWHRSAARFSNQWGWLAGGGLIALLMALPPVQNLILWFAQQVTKTDEIKREGAILIFASGFMAVMLAQVICVTLLTVIWRARMSRPV